MFNGRYTTLQEVIYRLKRNPLLSNIEVGDIAYDAMDVINLLGAPLIYESKVEFLDVEEFRTPLPCDFLNVLSVGKIVNNMVSPMVSSTSTRAGNWGCVDANGGNSVSLNTYAIKRGFIYTDFEEGTIEVNYKAVVLDDDGYPKIPDDVSVIKAIEASVKINHFTIKVDMGEMAEGPLRRAEQEYSWYIAQAQNKLAIPSYDEMESIKNGLIRIVSNFNQHDNGFRDFSINTSPSNIAANNLSTNSTAVQNQWDIEPTLEMVFNFGLTEVELAPITIVEANAGLYTTLQVDQDGSVDGTININGVDTPVPFTLTIGDTVIAKRNFGTAIGWLKITG